MDIEEEIINELKKNLKLKIYKASDAENFNFVVESEKNIMTIEIKGSPPLIGDIASFSYTTVKEFNSKQKNMIPIFVSQGNIDPYTRKIGDQFRIKFCTFNKRDRNGVKKIVDCINQFTNN